MGPERGVFSRLKHWRPLRVLLVSVGAVMISACVALGSGQFTPGGQRVLPAQSVGQAVVRPPASELTEVRVVATEFKFSPKVLGVRAGRSVSLVLDNQGALNHNLHVEALGEHLVAEPGQTASATVTFDQPGTVVLICSIPGHKEAGMQATLVVGPQDSRPAAPTPAQLTPAPAVQPNPASIGSLPRPAVAPPVNRTYPAVVSVELETKEVTARLANGVVSSFWTFNGTLPGPMIRVRQGDTVELTLKNAPDSQQTHSINLHAVTGPGGGAHVTQVAPGGQSTFRFKALNPGVFVYHCMTPMVGQHVAHGMYGMIVVEPPEGLPPVDREFYVMQGDFYLQGDQDDEAVRDFAVDKLQLEQPNLVLFNGGSITRENPLTAKVGETVRIFFGVGGPNLESSFHVVGEIFNRVYPEGASDPVRNVQTTLVPPGGATMVELKLPVPGTYMIEDHHIGRLEKGASAFIQVEGADNPEVFQHLDHPSGGN